MQLVEIKVIAEDDVVHVQPLLAKKQMQFLPSEVWFDVFGFLTLAQLGKRASLACCRFNALAQACIEHERHARVLPELFFLKSALHKNEYSGGIPLAVAEVKPPKNILDFKSIWIYHFDERAYNFLGLIKHMLTDPKLHILCKTHEGPDISALDKIMPMFRDCPAETFSVLYSANNLPSPFRHDHTAGLIQMFARFPEMLERKVHLFALKTHNSENEAESAILLQWLHAVPLRSGKPRLLALLRSYLERNREPIIAQIIQAFVSAEHPANFMVRIESSYRVVSCREFSMENARTGERLTMRRYYPTERSFFDKDTWFLHRCPINVHDQKVDEQALERELLEIADTPGTWNGRSEPPTRQSIFLHTNSDKPIKKKGRVMELDRREKKVLIVLILLNLVFWILLIGMRLHKDYMDGFDGQ